MVKGCAAVWAKVELAILIKQITIKLARGLFMR
jgi:hypothetical protein